MRAAHKKMNLTDEHFGAVAEHLALALVELGVPLELIDEVMAVAASVKDDVLNRDPVKLAVEVKRKATFKPPTDAVDHGTDRWIKISADDMTPNQAKAHASHWIEKQNKVVNGVYTFQEISIEKQDNDSMHFKFRVNFKLAKPNARWVPYEQDVDEKNARVEAMKWCDRMNKVVYGSYCYVAHDLNNAGGKAFSVHFRKARKV